MRNFKEYDIWKSSTELALHVYRICKSMPSSEKFGIISQMQRAAVSIPSNIAEGASRSSDVDFSRFLEIGLGSAFELETQLFIVKELGYIGVDDYQSVVADVHSLQKQISSFIKILRKGSKR